MPHIRSQFFGTGVARGLIVLVRTNPGYGPNPGHVGTGTIVSTLC